jgi:hypothetical protein
MNHVNKEFLPSSFALFVPDIQKIEDIYTLYEPDEIV